MTLGFTGTQQGMTAAQRLTVRGLFRTLQLTTLHHGDCIGADAQAHADALGECALIEIHPPDVDDKRAFCTAGKLWPPMTYLHRNRIIAQLGIDGLVATPKEVHMQQRSGTWATIRYARKLKRRIWIVYPDGTLREERNT